MAESDLEISRKVYFFKVAHFANVAEAIKIALVNIGNLQFNDQERYMVDGVSDYRYSVYPDTVDYPLKLRFGKIRRRGLPQTEYQGALAELNLQEDAGLIDIAHIIIDSDGFVAAEWNADGPKLAKLTPYLVTKGRINSAPSFDQLAERDILEVIQSMTGVHTLQVELPIESAPLAYEASKTLYDAVKSAEKCGATKKVALKLVASSDNNKLKDIAKAIAVIVKKKPHERDRFDEVTAIGRVDGLSRSKYVDILESKLLSTETFVRNSSKSRSLNSQKAYDTLSQALANNYERIKFAATVNNL